ncbi:MAG: hypothetical protein VX776_01120, partial [Planctomycetota bacterium]|nr:hypothetical protein [Planctomycetota bacterium]MEC9095197.1 hypothetical protein [Planctomycetota bacterium]
TKTPVPAVSDPWSTVPAEFWLSTIPFRQDREELVIKFHTSPAAAKMVHLPQLLSVEGNTKTGKLLCTRPNALLVIAT